ncbi:MAG: hypothetical protein GX992_00290, partial [Clostridium sp.]|nr:hypothetical protein [Clostridium sp.]
MEQKGIYARIDKIRYPFGEKVSRINLGMGKAGYFRGTHIPKKSTNRCNNWFQEVIMRVLPANSNPKITEVFSHYSHSEGNETRRGLKYYHDILESLQYLEGDETLLIQSGKPVGIFKTHSMAPRVLESNGVLVPAWATGDEFYKLVDKGLIVDDCEDLDDPLGMKLPRALYKTLVIITSLTRKHFAGSLGNKLVLSAGLGNLGEMLSLVVKANNGVVLIVEVDREKVEKKHELGYCDYIVDCIDDALVV